MYATQKDIIIGSLDDLVATYNNSFHCGIMCTPISVFGMHYPCYQAEYCMIEFFLPVTIVIIPDVLVINLITKLY